MVVFVDGKPKKNDVLSLVKDNDYLNELIEKYERCSNGFLSIPYHLTFKKRKRFKRL